MTEFSEKYGINEIRPFTFQQTRSYIDVLQREFIDLITAATPDAELVQLAHAIQRRGYDLGYGLQGVYTILYTTRDRLEKEAAQETMK